MRFLLHAPLDSARLLRRAHQDPTANRRSAIQGDRVIPCSRSRPSHCRQSHPCSRSRQEFVDQLLASNCSRDSRPTACVFPSSRSLDLASSPIIRDRPQFEIIRPRIVPNRLRSSAPVHRSSARDPLIRSQITVPLHLRSRRHRSAIFFRFYHSLRSRRPRSELTSNFYFYCWIS